MDQEQLGVLLVAGALGIGPFAGGDVDCPTCLQLDEQCLACRQGAEGLRQLLTDYVAEQARKRGLV